MNQNSLLLTIAIPVFNEISYLPKVIDSIISQTNDENRELFEVVISDNCSVDGTLEYLKSLVVDFNITILSNSENVSADLNFTKAILNASGEYVWLLGGQDYLSESAIDSILMNIRSRKPDLILLNFRIYDERTNLMSINTSYDHVIEDFFLSTYRFFVQTGGPGFAISSNVFSKDFYLFGNKDNKKHPNWVHLESLYSAIFNKKPEGMQIRYSFIKNPIFTLVREKNAWWHSGYVLMNYLALVELGLSKIRNPALNFRIRYRRCGLELRKSILLGLEQKVELHPKDFFRIVRMGWPVPQFWFLAFPLLIKSRGLWKKQ